MKKFFRIAFALVALAGMVMASSCSNDEEDDEEEITQEMWYHSYAPGDPFYYDNKDSKTPKFVDEPNYYGYNFDIKWTPASYIDTTQFEYELCWSEVEYDETNWHSFGRQKDTIYHFSDMNFDFGDDPEKYFYLTLNTYYWHEGHERRIQQHSGFSIGYCHSVYFRYSNNCVSVIFYDPVSYLGSMTVVVCDVDADKEVTKTYDTLEYVFNDSKSDKDPKIDNIDAAWSGYLKVQLYNPDGSLKTCYFQKVKE